jgi:outer membrane protein
MNVSRWHAWVLVSLLGLATSSATALDLLSAVRAARQSDPTLASAQAFAQAQAWRIDQARAGLRPTVNLTAGQSHQLFDTTLIESRTWDTRSLGASATLPLYRPAQRMAVEQSTLSARLAETQLERAQQALMLRVAETYFDVLATQDSLTVVQAQKRAIGEQYAAARRNFEVGTATVTDQQEAQARLDLTVAQEAELDNDLRVKRALLGQLVGQAITTLHTLRRDTQAPALAPEGERHWADAARADNLLVKEAELTSEVAQRELNKQRLGHHPTLDLTSQASLGRGTAGATSAALTDVRTTTAQIGLQAALPLYQGGAISARVRESIALLDKSQFDLETARRNAEQTARQTFLGVQSGLEQVRALTAAVQSSQLALESNQLGYQVGVRINIDVLNAAQQVFSTQRDLARARYGVLLNGLRLRHSAGTLTEQDIEQVNALLEPPPAHP